MTTRSEVLAALRESAESGVSGETLAARLGVSRVAVAKHVGALRDAGYVIQAVLGSGYRLILTPDAPLPDEVAPRLRSELWARLEGGTTTGSTNDDARALAIGDAPEGTVVLAALQTAGRGRLGRSWESPAGGVYLSAVLRPQVAPAAVSSLALAVALGVACGLESLGFEPRLKWPNDVLLEDGKVAGILLEMNAEADRVDYVVVGVGLNVRRPQHGAFEGAAYLTDHVESVRAARATAAVLDGIARTYSVWTERGFAGLAHDYASRSVLAGSAVSVRDLQGRVRAKGVVVGVDDDGRLLVEARGEVAAVSSGEVTLR
jgi:BirA family biotin operon repressor/biotin-[acetyl-CoA-carboxylase] ligase